MAESGIVAEAKSFAGQFGWSARVQRRVVHALLGLYVLGFCVFWPNALLVSDEAQYVSQAILFARGETTREVRNVLEGTRVRAPASTYPVGTSALQAPFVGFGGWRAAPIVSLLAIVGTVLVLSRWLSELGRPPIFASLPLLFVGTLVQGRLCMSDALTALISSLAFWLFSRGERGSRWAWIGAGVFAGLTAAFRDPTPLLFAPLFAGALLRRESRAWQLVVGGLAGLSVRFVTGRALFGSAWFLRMAGPSGAPLTLDALPPNLLLYGFILVLALPLGLPSVFLHRSARRVEIVLGTLALVSVYLMFPLPHDANSPVRDVVLHARYCTALVPLMALTLSEWIPRWLAAHLRVQRVLALGAASAATILIVTVHWYLYAWGATLHRISKVIYSVTPENSVLIVNTAAMGKFLCEAFGHRDFVSRSNASPEEIARFVVTGGTVYVAFLDRTEAQARRQDAAENTSFLARLRALCLVEELYDRQESSIERLRITRVPRCGSNPAGS
jgi:hypothetical protein